MRRESQPAADTISKAGGRKRPALICSTIKNAVYIQNAEERMLQECALQTDG